MAEPRRQSVAPWVAAAVAGLVVAALALVYFLVLQPDSDDVVGSLTSDEKTAVAAASTEAANVLSYRRAHFDADFQRAVNGATGSLKSDLGSQKATTLKVITQGKFDMSAKVTRAALEGRPDKATGDSYLVLVTLNGYQSSAQDQPVPSQLELTMQKVKDVWLANNIVSVGLSS
jgi:hypothetical protein